MRPAVTLEEWAKRLALAGTAALLSLTGVEVMLWLVAPITLQGYRASVRQSLPGIAAETVVTANEWGYRSASMRSLEKPERTLRVLCLGASTTESLFQSDQDAWFGRLERRLAQALPGLHIEVVAWGRGGETVADRVLWARTRLRELDPDVVVTLEGINDLCWHGGPDYRYDPGALEEGLRRRETAARFGGNRWDALARRRSQIYRRLLVALEYCRAREAVSSGRARAWLDDELRSMRAAYLQLPHDERPSRQPDPLLEFRDGLDRLLRLLRGHGAEVVVLAQPTLWKETLAAPERAALWFQVYTPRGPVRAGNAWLAREMARYNREQRALAERVGALFVPLDELLPRDLVHFVDDCHFTDAGSAVVAGLVQPAAVEALERSARRRGLPLSR